MRCRVVSLHRVGDFGLPVSSDRLTSPDVCPDRKRPIPPQFAATTLSARAGITIPAALSLSQQSPQGQLWRRSLRLLYFLAPQAGQSWLVYLAFTPIA